MKIKVDLPFVRKLTVVAASASFNLLISTILKYLVAMEVIPLLSSLSIMKKVSEYV